MARITRIELADALKAAVYAIDHHDVTGLVQMAREALERAYKEGLVPSSRRRPECTGIAAVWCPICGDCSCSRDDSGEFIEDSDADECPLHGCTSQHGE